MTLILAVVALTLIGRLEEFFRKFPNVWHDGHVLAKVGGFYAFRSRCSELRLKRHMNIINRQRKGTTADGQTFTISEYMFVPPQPKDLIEIAESNQDDVTTEAACR